MSNQLTITMYAHKADGAVGREYDIYHWDMSEHGYICLGPVEVTFTAPETDPVAAELESIDKAITALRADFQAKLNALEGRADDLLAIAHNKESDDE